MSENETLELLSKDVKYYENPIQLSASEYGRGGVHTYTIHQEKNEHLIDKIKDIMRYDYREE